MIERLIANLDDRDGSVRFFSAIALRKVTGLDYGYEAHATESERALAIARWKEWFHGTPEATVSRDRRSDLFDEEEALR